MYRGHPNIIKTYRGHPNISGGVQTCGAIQTYAGHPNIRGCPNIQGAFLHAFLSHKVGFATSEHICIDKYVYKISQTVSKLILITISII